MKAEDVLKRLEDAYHGQYTGVDRQDMLSKLNSYEPEDLVTLYAAVLNTYSKRFKSLPGPCEIEAAIKYNRESEDPRPIRRRKQEEARTPGQEDDDGEPYATEEQAASFFAAIYARVGKPNPNGYMVFHSMDDHTPPKGVGKAL